MLLLNVCFDNVTCMYECVAMLARCVYVTERDRRPSTASVTSESIPCSPRHSLHQRRSQVKFTKKQHVYDYLPAEPVADGVGGAAHR